MTAVTVVVASGGPVLAEENVSVTWAADFTYVSKLSSVKLVTWGFTADPVTTATTNYITYSGRTLTFKGSSTATVDLSIKGIL